jgi:hypothetical protein
MREKLIELLDKAKSGYEDYLAEKDRKMRMAKTDADFEAEANTIEIRHSFYARELITNGVTVQGWIPVSERLPEDRGDVLVTLALFGERMRPQIGWYNEVASIWYIIEEDRCFTSNEVTHWMPLPTPPKED